MTDRSGSRRGTRTLAGLVVSTLLAATAPARALAASVVPEVWQRAAVQPSQRVLVRVRADARGASSTARSRSLSAAVGARVSSVLGTTSHRVERTYDSIPFAVLEVGSDALVALDTSPEVVAVVPDRATPLDLINTSPLVEAPQAWEAGFEGGGRAVAVIDSGVEVGHPFLGGRTVAEACFSHSGCPNGQATQVGPGAAAPCAFLPNVCGHGTHVAGIAVGHGLAESPPRFGVARGASLVAVNAASRAEGADCSPSSSPCVRLWQSDILAAMDWIHGIAAIHGVAAVNLSLGVGNHASPAACDAAEPAYKAMVDALAADGIATVASSSNNGVKTGISAPACISTAIGVGATTKTDEVPSFSNSASFLPLLAPGAGFAANEGVLSSWPGGTFKRVYGTSMASPHVAGAVALLREAHPQASVPALLAALRAGGLPVTDPANGVTTPRLRVGHALDALAAGSCVASDTRLCLLGGRFSATLSWNDGSGARPALVASPKASGEGSASGLFHFYPSDPSNWEVLVKMIDGCGTNGRFWMLVSASTGFGWELVVTDERTGESRTWRHPLDGNASGLSDFEAFAGCGA
ncbi:S8 family serine peptidase [bacterium]|nr:S8 family serine peptidase [bacterium]